jgi:hypothetical protein
MAFLINFKAVITDQFMMNLEFKDLLLFLDLHFSIYNDPAAIKFILELKYIKSN